MVTEIQGGVNMENFMSDDGAPTHKLSDHSYMECSLDLLHIMIKYNISTSTNETHHHQQNPDQLHIQVYKKRIIPSWVLLVLLDMCVHMPFFLGLITLSAWLNISSSLHTTNYDNPYNIMIKIKSLT